MKHFIGFAILVMGVAVPAHAQTHAVASSAGSQTAAGGGGGFGGGSASVSRLTNSAPRHFEMISASGSEQSYVPSTFLPYDEAITAAENVRELPAPTVAEVARQRAAARTEKPRVALVQDEYGRAIIVRR
jgi:hypothetical protein